jgi:hypothetical protein
VSLAEVVSLLFARGAVKAPKLPEPKVETVTTTEGYFSTPELRWIERREPFNGSPTAVSIRSVLQQRWISKTAEGGAVWVDVPVVKEVRDTVPDR